MIKTGKDKEIWRELQKQLEAKGLKVKKGVIHATFITAVDVLRKMSLGIRQKQGGVRKEHAKNTANPTSALSFMPRC